MDLCLNVKIHYLTKYSYQIRKNEPAIDAQQYAGEVDKYTTSDNGIVHFGTTHLYKPVRKINYHMHGQREIQVNFQYKYAEIFNE